MNNQDFLETIKRAFIRFLETSSRSNEKLKILHGTIAADLATRLGENYIVKSLGFEKEKEGNITGRYIDKNVDISIFDRNNKPLAAIGVKFVMQNYAQNSNNYFENMLGETANIQCQRIPYFQIFIIPDTLPYYDNKRIIQKWENFNDHHAKKYLKLSEDNSEIWLHTPAKTLFYIVNLPHNQAIQNQEQYQQYYLHTDFAIQISHQLDHIQFDNGLILNDYDSFMNKVTHRILSL